MNFKRLIALLFMMNFVFGIAAFAQERVVTGKVTDSKDGTPLANITVQVKGSKNATQTAADGTFKVKVSGDDATLIVTSIGYSKQEVSASGTPISVSLVQSNFTLNEIVVVGYGTVKKKDLTGAVTTVSAKDFQKGAISTPEQMISGKVAGVSIISNSGQPGAGSTIRIRGGASLRASNDPLIVIDGVPLDNDAIKGAGNPLSFINANDIESFTVLKDASAAAIYGTRAANGVIIITTKKGKSGALKVSFSSVNSLSSLKKELPVLNGNQIRSIVTANGTAAQKAMLGNANTDWQKEIFQNAFSTDNNLTISGGFKKFPYRISLGFQNQDGILKTDNLQKTSVGIAVNPTFFDNHLKVDLNLKGSTQSTRFANTGAIGAAAGFDPTQNVYSNSKRFGGYYEWLDPSTPTGLNLNAGRNPVGLLNQQLDKSTPQRSIGNLQLDYKFHFLPDLHANLNAGYDISKGEGNKYISDSAASNYIAGGKGGQNNYYKSTKQNTLFEFYLNYVKEFKKYKTRIDATAGYSYNNYLTKNYNYAEYYAKGTVSKAASKFAYDEPEHSLISYFGRVNLGYDDKYLLTATIRRDGSSRFSPNNRWGMFPSAAFAWKVINEPFINNSKIISDLKLRVGYGITGQQDGVGNYDYLSYYNYSDVNASYQFGNVFYQMYRPGGFYANRKWEQTATTNIAVDFGLLKNRITGSVDLYMKKTSDLLNEVAQPAGTNFSAYTIANVGNMENKGIEVTLNTIPIKEKDLTWDVAFNVTYNKNEITNLTVIPNDPNYPGFYSTNISGVQGFAYLNAVGSSKNTFNLYKQVFDYKTGAPIEGMFQDRNRDGIINESDKYKGKSADPKVFLGFSTNLSYKNWNAGCILRASFDNYVYNNVYSNNGRLNQIIGGATISNASINYLTTHFVGSTDKQLLSDYYIENASFLRMDNLNIGYNFGKVLKSINSLRANFSVQNVFTITKYSGLDPEISNGVDNNNYPRPVVYTLGINLDL